MTEAIALLWVPFLVALCLTGIHTYLGIQVLARKIIFVDLAMAQIAALGATVAFMLGHPVSSGGSYAWSLAFTLAAAMLLAFSRRWSGRVSQEAFIGVIYVVAAAAVFLLVEKAPQGTEHIKQVLTGNILTTGADDLLAVVPLYLVVAFALWSMQARAASSGEGWRRWLWDFLFYACFGVVVTSSVALAGVLLVFSFLIVPAMIGVLYANRADYQLWIGWVVGAAASMGGLIASYAWDLPTGSAMVCVFGVVLALAGLVRPALRGDHKQSRQVRRVARMVVGSLLIVSGTWLMLAPRADQPLFDVAEYAVPGVRAVYMNSRELVGYRDADLYSKRYRDDAARLNEREVTSRSQGPVIDDMEVRRISSFLQSYNEMMKGEEFVKREIRGRARDRMRWIAGADNHPSRSSARALAQGAFPGYAARAGGSEKKQLGKRRTKARTNRAFVVRLAAIPYRCCDSVLRRAVDMRTANPERPEPS